MSKVYREIVTKNIKKTQKDIRYMVAYALYKQHKKEFIEDYEEKNGESPGAEKLNEFQDSSLTQTSIENLYAKTDKILTTYGNTVFKNKIAQFNKIHVEINRKKHFWGGVFQSVVGAFIFAFLLFLIGLMINFSKEGGIKEILLQWLEGN